MDMVIEQLCPQPEIFKPLAQLRSVSLSFLQLCPVEGSLLPTPKGHKFAYQVIGDDLVCSNDPARYKGQVQSEILVTQRAGWAVAVLTVSEWTQLGRRIVEEGRDEMTGLELIVSELDEKAQQAVQEINQI
jgi:hypothetical protein